MGNASVTSWRWYCTGIALLIIWLGADSLSLLF